MTNRKRVALALVVLGAIGAAAWYGWREYTTPQVPKVSMAGMNKEQAEKLERAMEQARLAPRDGAAWGELGLALMANGFFDEAIVAFASAQRFAPDEPRWPYFQGGLMIQAGQREGYTKLREARAAARAPRDRTAVLIQMVQALVEDGQYDEAEGCVSELREVGGAGPAFDFVAGLLARGRGDRAAARDHLSRVVNHPSARKRATSLLAGLTDDERLAREYNQRADALPKDVPWPDSFEIGLGKYRASAQDPRAALYRELESQGRHDEALAVLRELVASSPDESSCGTLAVSLLQRKEFEEASRLFRQAIVLNPRNAKSYMFLGVCFLEMGDRQAREPGGKERAADLYRQAVAAEDEAALIQNDVADVHLARARALKRLGRTDEAIAAFRKAAQTGTEYAEMHQALGEALCEAGQVKEGLGHLENAVRIARPNEPGPRKALEAWKAKGP